MKVTEIVLVDDSEMDILLTKQILKHFISSEKVKSYSDSIEALEYFNSCSIENSLPELIILDINMPGMSGFDILEAIDTYPKEVTKKTRIIMISSSDDEEDIQRSTRFPKVVKYIVKPVSVMDFEKLEDFN